MPQDMPSVRTVRTQRRVVIETDADRLRFAVQFAQMDMDTMREGDWLNVREDYEAFLAVGVDTLPLIAMVTEPYEVMTAADFREVQVRVRLWICALAFPPQALACPPPAVLMSGNVMPLAGSQVYVQAHPRELFLWRLFLLLLREPRDRMHCCAECGTIFYRVKHQAYCSRACGNRVTQRRWRTKHGVSQDARRTD